MFEPKQNIVDSTVLIPNLLRFITTNQSDAFQIINPGGGLKSFAAVYSNATGRVVDKYPSFVIASDQLETAYANDLLDGKWRVVIEVAIEGSDADKLTIEARKYRDAVELMLNNIGNELVEGSRRETISQISERPPVSTFDEISRTVKSKYAQVFTILVEYQIRTNAY